VPIPLDCPGSLMPIPRVRPALAGLLAAALLTPSIATSQSRAKPKESAFGFAKGMTLNQVQAVAKIEKVPNTRSSYVTRKPPAPVAFLRLYTVIVSPTVGLCAVMATTDDPPNFLGVKEAGIEHISQSLQAKYGLPGLFHLRDPYVTVWWNPLGPGTSIWLSVSTDEIELTRSVTVTYDFSNIELCRAERL